MFLKNVFFVCYIVIFTNYFLLTQIETKKKYILKKYSILNNNKIISRSLRKNKLCFIQKEKNNVLIRRHKYGGNHHKRAFLVFDIIKIFGRLSNKELLGHVISHNNDFIENNKKNCKKNWEILFQNDTINYDILKTFLEKSKFEWPLTVNSGQIKKEGPIDIPVSPIVYIENCRKISDQFKNKNKNTKINLKIINDYVNELPISTDAIQCVFSSFSDLEYLTKENFIQKIHEWAPSDGVLDWYTFVYNLKEEPTDNIKKFFD
ncbi:conserved Plasmodium protein, unknown function [Plasmodium chabaudi chabaudi]|uniref:Uncharacterized protein n=2 Tax=Plasmodium chabaudi TaxID=5825 RepID=A0A1C6YIS8_PLACE|nr:conserved Plasmodium protein, unknown function [Plasmodium chabaudi adami]SCN62084.1 conserved Plasmodium protein, unknown function [Plasmodium chabaudi chabaudi]SCN62085.1 conserved Plasmodium protein, unknown function [Plasmodium chabaudi adami]